MANGRNPAEVRKIIASTRKSRILFTGYAHVHFLCFRPLYERLITDPDVELFVSGGLRTKTGSGYELDEQAMYRPLGVPSERVLPVAEIQERDFDLLFAANTKLIMPRRAGARIQIFHGVSFRNRAVRRENMGCDFYFVTGPYMRRRFDEAGLLTEDDRRAIPVGFMKTDRLLNGELSRSELLRHHGFDGNRPILLYAPTGQFNNSLETMGEELIGHLTRSGRYDLLIKPHDHPKNREIDWFDRLSRFEDEHCRTVRDLDVVPLLYLADLLITDASSVSSEYSLRDRPMIFLDVPELIERSRLKEDSMLDLDTWGRRGGSVVKRPQDITAAVQVGLRQPALHEEVRREMAQDLFYNPGRATDAALSWLKGHLFINAPSGHDGGVLDGPCDRTVSATTEG